ncbi:hypothetical protein VFC49_10670 [Thermococcus sp. SY098]|uniref:hypothetical protein n=1 Tax=Thermococcus sp. SY098 TaxID=3111325 RepID=UPI002D79FA13|nr:hypothetical protein [Thermococcus sp. SY098]WRS52470.1 hypothetical protein VFC49_10670 [Thermococcus sp. SY098]
MFTEMLGVIGFLLVLFRSPPSKNVAEDDFRVSLGLLLALFLGLTLLYSDPEYFAEFYQTNSWAIILSPVTAATLIITTVITYRRLKRFEQEEMLEKLAEKVGEKLGESMAKGLKAKET